MTLHPTQHTRHRHLDTELLSAYLDREIGLVEARAVETHLENCLTCRGRLADLKRVVASLGSLGREAPPPWLARQVQSAVAAPRPGLWERFFDPLLQVPLRSPIGSTLSMATGLAVVCLLALSGERVDRQGLPGLATYPGPVAYPTDDPNFVLTQTTSEIAGRTFVLWEDEDLWVEQREGLRPLQPEARVTVSSPRGRALIARYEGLGDLLADGSRVVMRYRTETLELWSGS